MSPITISIPNEITHKEIKCRDKKTNFRFPLMKKEQINPSTVTSINVGTVTLMNIAKVLDFKFINKGKQIIDTYNTIAITKEVIDTFRACLKKFFI